MTDGDKALSARQWVADTGVLRTRADNSASLEGDRV